MGERSLPRGVTNDAGRAVGAAAHDPIAKPALRVARVHPRPDCDDHPLIEGGEEIGRR